MIDLYVVIAQLKINHMLHKKIKCAQIIHIKHLIVVLFVVQTTSCTYSFVNAAGANKLTQKHIETVNVSAQSADP